MDKKLEQIYDKNINTSFVLDKEGVFKSMEESYELGTKEVLDWLSKMDYLSDNITYIIEEWNNKKQQIKS
jgi:lipoate-protein ligase A